MRVGAGQSPAQQRLIRRGRASPCRFCMEAGVERLMLGDLTVDCLPMIVIVGEGVINRSEREMGILLQQLFGCHPVKQRRSHDRSHGDACPRETWTASADLGVAGDMGMGNR